MFEPGGKICFAQRELKFAKNRLPKFVVSHKKSGGGKVVEWLRLGRVCQTQKHSSDAFSLCTSLTLSRSFVKERTKSGVMVRSFARQYFFPPRDISVMTSLKKIILQRIVICIVGEDNFFGNPSSC